MKAMDVYWDDPNNKWKDHREQPTLILARGVSGSGKSTLAKTLWGLNADEVYEISTDIWFTDEEGNYNFDPSKIVEYHQKTIDRVDMNMQHRRDCYDLDPFTGMPKKLADYCPEVIIVHNTFVEEWEMTPYFELAEKYGWKVTTIIVENRHGGENTHEVPRNALDRQEQKFNIKLS